MYYGEPTTMIVVYKDELVVNQLKKLIETKDDAADGVVNGVADGSVQIVTWTEKVWLEQKKTGNINAKVLFLGDIKGTDKLIPVLDIKYNKYGVKYGWAGNQAVITVEPKAIKSREEYAEFLSKLSELPAPAIVKEAVRATESHSVEVKNESGKVDVKRIFSSLPVTVADAAKDVFSNKKLLKQQMLIFGVINMYNEGLEAFVKA